MEKRSTSERHGTLLWQAHRRIGQLDLASPDLIDLLYRRYAARHPFSDLGRIQRGLIFHGSRAPLTEQLPHELERIGQLWLQGLVDEELMALKSTGGIYLAFEKTAAISWA